MRPGAHLWARTGPWGPCRSGLTGACRAVSNRDLEIPPPLALRLYEDGAVPVVRAVPRGGFPAGQEPHFAEVGSLDTP